MTDFNTALQQLEAELNKYVDFCRENKATVSSTEIEKAQEMVTFLNVLHKKKPLLASNNSGEDKTQEGSFSENIAIFRKKMADLKAKFEGNKELNELLSNLKNS